MVAAVQPAAAQDAAPVNTWYEALRTLQTDETRGAVVEELTLQRDVGTFRLIRGRIQLLRAVDGRTFGAAFTGEGRFEMGSPEPIETAQLKRVYDKEALDEPFRSAVFLFTDLTLEELSGRLDFAPMVPPDGMDRELRQAGAFITDGDGWASPTVLMPLLNGGPGFFYGHVVTNGGDPLIFSFDPHVFEEVSLSRRADRVDRPETVVQFHRESDYASGRSIPQEALDLVAITEYSIDTQVDDRLELAGRARVRLRRLQQSYDWVPFRLFSELKVDSIQWEDGSAAPFQRAGKSEDLWVDVSGAPADGGLLTFHYAGKMMERPRGLWVILHTHSTWFPIYEAGREIRYTLTFRTPAEFTVTAVGTLVEESTANEVTTRVWDIPAARMVTFNIGEFDRFEADEPDVPPLTILVNERAHRVLGGLVAESGGLLFTQGDMARTVSLDLLNSIRFYTDVYGPNPMDHFVATEIPYSHGEAFPGLVMLAWNTFQYTGEQGFDEIFRAHEVAHQWWGIGVRPATYRDWWLAEGFSEFSGWWYAARARGSVELYLRRLKETREALLRRRDRAAPVGLGRRVANSREPEDYERIVYHKGAWVLHMLRTMLTNPETGNDDAFTSIMRTFYTRYVGGPVTTASFRSVAEEVVDADLGWFFEQWINGSAIPSYTFSHRYEEQADGQIRATIRVRQEQVDDSFRMIVPVLLDFGDEGNAVVQVNVTGPLTEYELPLLPRIPDAIVFNPYEAVLADTRTERWRNEEGH